MADNTNVMWVFGLIDTNGKTVKTLSMAFPSGVEIEYVTITKKTNDDVSAPEKPIPIRRKSKEAKLIREESPPIPGMMPRFVGYSSHPGYYPPYGQYMSPIPHPIQHPMFLHQQQQPHPLSQSSVAIEEKQLLQQEEEKKEESPIQEDVPFSPLPDKDFERKQPTTTTSYAKVAGSFTPNPKTVPQEPKQKPPSAPTKPKRVPDKKGLVDHYEPPARKALPFTKPTVESLMQKTLDIPEGYEPISDEYPRMGNYNFFLFQIPSRYRNSRLAQRFPQTYKYRILVAAVGLDNMHKVQGFWDKEPKSKTFKIDYPTSAFYFAPFYHLRAVYPKNTEDEFYHINKCHIFNRFFCDKPEKQCKFADKCFYLHMCMICGSTDHSAFKRVSIDDKTYVCEEHAKMVQERKDFLEEGLTDQEFIDDMDYYDNIDMNGQPDEPNEEPKTVYADQSVSALPVVSAPASSNSPTKEPSLVSDAVFPPLSINSPSHKKKKNNKKSSTKSE